MDWTQAFAIIGTIGAFIFWVFSKLDNDSKTQYAKLDSDIKSLSDKLDTNINALTAKIDADIKASTQRTDQLYQMFIDLLKERK